MASLMSMLDESSTEKGKMTIDKMSETFDDIFKINTKKSNKILSDLKENKKDIYDSIYNSNNPIEAINRYNNKELKISEKDALLWDIILDEKNIPEDNLKITKGERYGTYLTYKNGALSNEEAKYLAQFSGLDSRKDIQYTKNDVREKIASWTKENEKQWIEFENAMEGFKPSSIKLNEQQKLDQDNYYNNVHKKIENLNKQNSYENAVKNPTIDDIRIDPTILMDEKNTGVYSRSRELADRAFYGNGKTGHANNKALNNFSEMALADHDFLFNIDASDEVLTDVYHNINNKQWQENWIKRNYNNGKFTEFDFKGKKWNKLSQEQQSLITNRAQDIFDSFNNAMEGVSGDGVMHKGPTVRYGPGGIFTHQIETEGITREFSPQAARRNYMTNKLLGGNADNFDNAVTNAIEKANTQEQKDALNAYRSYMNKAMEEASTTRHGTMNEIMRQHASIEAADGAEKLLKKEMESLSKGLGHDGISKAAKHTGLKVAGKLAIGALAIMGLGEIFDED